MEQHRIQSRPKADRPRRAGRIDVAGLRREQIVEAASAIIEEQGIQRLSLSEIEARTGMSRGQLTYYFPEKEQILLAVFDRMVGEMRKRGENEHGVQPSGSRSEAKRRMHQIADIVLKRPAPDQFAALQYSFLAQMRHRDDFRERLAALYEEWRTRMTDDWKAALPRASRADRRARATVFQAILHGLTQQFEVDPAAFNIAAVRRVCNRVMNELIGETRGRR